MTIITVLIFFSFLWWGIVSYAKDLEMNKKFPKSVIVFSLNQKKNEKNIVKKLKSFLRNLDKIT